MIVRHVENTVKVFTAQNLVTDLESSWPMDVRDVPTMVSYDKIIPWLTAEIHRFDPGEPSLSADLPKTARIGRHSCARITHQSPGAGRQRALRGLGVERGP